MYKYFLIYAIFVAKTDIHGMHPLRIPSDSPPYPRRHFFSSSSVFLQCFTEEILKNGRWGYGEGA